MLGCGRVYGVSVKGVEKLRCRERGERDRRVVGSVEKCVGVWGEVRGDVERGVGGGVGRSVEDVGNNAWGECRGCGNM